MDFPSTIDIESLFSESAELSCALSEVTLPCVVLVRSESRGAHSVDYENADNALFSLCGSEYVLRKKDSVRIEESTNECCSRDQFIKRQNGSVIALFEKSLIQTVRLRIMKFDTPTRQELTYGPEFVHQHNEQVGQEVRIPLKYKGKVHLHSSVKRGKHYFNISQVIKDFPPCIRVEEELTVIRDNGQECNVLPRGLQLNLIKVDNSSEEVGKNAGLICRCQSTVLNLPLTCKGHFTANTDDNDYTLQEIVENFPLPKTVTFNKLEIKDFISVSEADNDILFNALSGPVEILSVENIETYMGCEHQKSVNMLYDIAVIPTFSNLSVHLSKDVINTNKLLDEYFLKPTFKFVTFIESNLFSFGSVSCVPIYLQFPSSDQSPVKDDLMDHEKEMKLSCPLYDSPSASTLPDKPLCSKGTGPQPTRIITRKEGVRRCILQAEESLQRLSVKESVFTKTMDGGQCFVDQYAGKQLKPNPGNPGYVLENADEPEGMSGYTLLFRDVDNYDIAAEDSDGYEPINVNDDEYEYISVPHEASSLTSPSEAKQEQTSRPLEDSVHLMPAYQYVNANKIMINKETVSSGDPQKHGTPDLSSSQKAALYENVEFKWKK
ncbi:hypothetical protein CHS0354_019371 [Potamilus streckersoni]|uniref:CABIT domain-containing protein n=1 Tax=Potamilus streckersoni TaxID=2493646 RepID=A0AAE0SIJ1_9BIVA|nr:hypothetical protein CHS0354_019371 [Potamilus streckersoni]